MQPGTTTLFAVTLLFTSYDVGLDVAARFSHSVPGLAIQVVELKAQ